VSESARVPPREMRRVWRVVTWAGLLGSIYYLTCITGAPRIKFLTELGATAFHFGLISGLGALVIAFQIVGSVIGNRIRRRKPLWIVLAITHRAAFLGVLVTPLLFTEPQFQIAWIILSLVLHDAIAQIGVPVWFSWMADLVPRESMTRHWAVRQGFITFANIAAMVAVAVWFHVFEIGDRIIAGFTVIAGVGLFLGIIDILLFLAVPEPPHERTEGVPLRQTLMQPLRDSAFRPFLLFMGYWQFAVFMAAPFFGLYMIDDVGLNVFAVQLIGAAGALGIAVSSSFWGLVCDGFGYGPVLRVLSFGKAFTPVAVVLASRVPGFAIPALAVVMFVDGILNAGMNLAMQGTVLKSTPRRNRTMYIAAANFVAVGVMAALSPVIAGKVIDYVNFRATFTMGSHTLNGYHTVFVLSTVLRFGAVALAVRIREANQLPLRIVLSELRPRRSLPTVRYAKRLNSARQDSARAQAAKRLGEMKSVMALGELLDALHDPSPRVREACADALGVIGASNAVAPLAQALFDRGSGIQSRAARALGKIGSVDSLRALLTNLRNQDSEALHETIDALAEMGHEAAVVPLMALFNDVQDNSLRRHIAEALGKLCGAEPAEEVVSLLLGRRPLNQQTLR